MCALTLPIGDNQFEQLIDQLGPLPTYTIGRRADNEIVINNGKVSGHHACLIQCTNNSFIIEDLDSKNGTFANDARITRKVVDRQTVVRLADADYTVDQLLDVQKAKSAIPLQAKPLPPRLPSRLDKDSPDFTSEFAALQQVSEQYPKLRRACRDREKMIRTGSVILSSIVGISAVLTTGGGALPFIQLLSSAGLGVLIPTLCSTLLSTDEKLELIDKEFREQYRCPNPACRDPFGTREWEVLAQQKTCRRCPAIWVK